MARQRDHKLRDQRRAMLAWLEDLKIQRTGALLGDSFQVRDKQVPPHIAQALAAPVTNVNLMSAAERTRREQRSAHRQGEKKGTGGRGRRRVQTQAERSALLMEGKKNDQRHAEEQAIFSGISEEDTSRRFIDPNDFYLTMAPHPPKPRSQRAHLLRSSSSSSPSSSVRVTPSPSSATVSLKKLNRNANEGLPVSKRRSVFADQERQMIVAHHGHRPPVPSSSSTTMDLPQPVRLGPLFRDDNDNEDPDHDFKSSSLAVQNDLSEATTDGHAAEGAVRGSAALSPRSRMRYGSAFSTHAECGPKIEAMASSHPRAVQALLRQSRAAAVVQADDVAEGGVQAALIPPSSPDVRYDDESQDYHHHHHHHHHREHYPFAGDVLDRILSSRQRTVSRGHAASRGLSTPWDGQEARDAAEKVGREEGRQERVLDFEDEDREYFGTSRRWTNIDTGAGSSVGQGDDLVKKIDPMSRRLIDAEDRRAFGGIAPFPSGKRKPRDGGSQKIMLATLAMIDAQSHQSAQQRVQESWGRKEQRKFKSKGR